MRLMHRSRRRRSARAGLLCRLFSPSHPGKLLIVSGRQAPRQGEQEGMQMNYRFHAGIAALATCLAGSPVQAQERERKRGVEGKRGAVRGGLGGRVILKTKKKTYI